MSFKYRIIAVPILVIIVVALKTQGTAVHQYNSNYIVEVIESSPKAQAAFSTFWCKETQSLYYCDSFFLNNCSLMHYIPAENKTYCATVQNFPYIYFIMPIEGKPDHFAVATNKTIEEIKWDGKSANSKWIRTIITAETCTEFQNNTFAGAKADRHGRLFVGTRRYEICYELDTIPTYGNLFRIYRHSWPYTLNKPETIRFSSGAAWDYGKNKFYYVDSCAYDIKSFDYCPKNGDIWNERVVYNYTDSGESPINFLKALEIDDKGNLFVTTFQGGNIIVICPWTGREIIRISIPCAQVSSITFAGKYLDEIIVATAATELLADQEETCGQLYRVRGLDARGLYANKACV